MKIISLNMYGGIVFEPLMQFIEKHSDADVFCLQEAIFAKEEGIPLESNGARTNLVQEIAKRLPDHDFKFAPMQDGFDTVEAGELPIAFGLVTFWKKSMNVESKQDFFVYKDLNTLKGQDYSTLGSNAVIVTFDVNGEKLSILNTHGMSEPADKLDSPARISQSGNILNGLEDIGHAKIIMGDFNLYPDTESIQLFERAGYRNLIKEFDIKDTRGSMNKKLHPEYEHGKYGFQPYADYTFVTDDVQVKQFDVPDEPISDHLPMILEIK
jgi:hypothetical protein